MTERQRDRALPATDGCGTEGERPYHDASAGLTPALRAGMCLDALAAPLVAEGTGDDTRTGREGTRE